jgi:hypothetical protein
MPKISAEDIKSRADELHKLLDPVNSVHGFARLSGYMA